MKAITNPNMTCGLCNEVFEPDQHLHVESRVAYHDECFLRASLSTSCVRCNRPIIGDATMSDIGLMHNHCIGNHKRDLLDARLRETYPWMPVEDSRAVFGTPYKANRHSGHPYLLLTKFYDESLDTYSIHAFDCPVDLMNTLKTFACYSEYNKGLDTFVVYRQGEREVWKTKHTWFGRLKVERVR